MEQPLFNVPRPRDTVAVLCGDTLAAVITVLLLKGENFENTHLSNFKRLF